MIIDWPAASNEYLDRLEADAGSGERRARLVLDRVLAQLEVLQDLDGEPAAESATLKRVRQSGR